MLQAADIAMYKASLVPVGKDQAAHLELSREIVRAFNNRYGETFPEPQAVFTEAPTVIGHRRRPEDDASRSATRSTSWPSPDVIRKQVMSHGHRHAAHPAHRPGRPEVCNVCQLHRFFGDDFESIWDGERTARTGCVDTKRLLAERITEQYAPARERYLELQSAARQGRRDSRRRGRAPRAHGRRNDGRGPRKDGACVSPMGFELTPRERRWFDVILVLGAVALGFIVLTFVGAIFAIFGDLIMVFFLAWLLAFMLGPLVNRVTAIPLMTRTGAIFSVYLVIFGGLVVVTILVAAALFSSLQDFIANLPSLRANLPSIIAPWQERVNGLGFTNVDLLAQVTVFFDNISQYAAQLVAPLQQLAVASIGAIGNLLLVVVLSLYMVADRERIQAFLFWLIPTQYRAEAEILEEAVSRSFGGFIRGQVVTGLVFALICFLASLAFGLDFIAVTTATAGVLMAIPFFGPFVAWIPPVLVAILTKPDSTLLVSIVVLIGWLVVMNGLQPRIMSTSLRIHPIVVLGSVLVGLKIAGIPGAIFGIPIAAVISALFLYQLNRRRGNGPVAERAAARVTTRVGRAVRRPREPDPTIDKDVDATDVEVAHARPMTPAEQSATKTSEP